MGQKNSTQSSAKAKRTKGKQPSHNKTGSWFFSIPTATSALRDLIGTWTDFENGRVQRREMKLTGEAIRDTIPTVKCFMNALAAHFKHQNYLELFYAFINGSNSVLYWVEVLQGSSALEEIGKKIHRELEAQTGLIAPEKFARRVDRCIRYEVRNTPFDGRHFYFIYHPDTDWHAEFFHRVKGKLLPDNFLGMSENLDSLCAWMLFLRRYLNGKQKKPRFYLIIPAYRPMLVKDPLIFPEELFPLTIRGDIHDSSYYVWLNLPTIGNLDSDLITLDRVGNLARPPNGWADAAATAAATGTFAAGATVTLAAVATAATLCPPLAPLAFVGGVQTTFTATEGAQLTVEGMLKDPEPRVLGQFQDEHEACNTDGSENSEEDETHPDDMNFNPTTRRVSRRKRRRRRRREAS